MSHSIAASAAGSTTACASSPADQLDPNTAQTPGMDRKAAINFARVGAQKLWAGTVHIHPDAKTGAHHHGQLESVIYVVKGRARMRWGERARVHRRGRPGRLHLHPAVRAAPGDQRQRRRDARVRALPQRRRGGRGQPRHRAGREARDGALDRSDPSARLSMADSKLSVLDQSVSLAGSSEDAAIRDTLSLAEHCERLGYARFWLSEHHGLPTIVGSAPEILMAAIAARTTRIRIGSAGVMLPHYSALKVAEQFRVLEALAPGRIDLGVGRAPGGDMRTARALNPNAGHARPRTFRCRCATCRPGRRIGRHAGITAHPLGPHAPEIWILGSSDYGAQLAAHFGLPYAFAYFFTDGQGAEQAIALYRRLYQPSERHPRAAGDALHLGAGRRRATRRRRTSRCRAIAGASTARAASSARCSRRTRSPRAASTRRRAGDARADARARPSSARPRRSARGSARLAARLRARRGRDQHLGPRSGGAAHVVCAARRGVRAAQRGAERRR